MIRTVDIETISNELMLKHLPPVEPKYGNTKDPEKRRAIEEEAKAAQISHMALNPFYGRICVIGIMDEDGRKKTFAISKATDEEEKQMLANFFPLLGLGSRLTLITWNGNGFDLPFLYKRAMLLGLDVMVYHVPPLAYWTKRYTTSPHCDLMQVFGGWRENLKLNVVASAVLHEKKDDVDVTKFADMIVAGRVNEISSYCLRDVVLTHALYERANGYLF